MMSVFLFSHLSRGREGGGASPRATVSGSRAAVPAPPPLQLSIGASHSMPPLRTPPTVAAFTSTSVPSTFSAAPGSATTQRAPTARLGAFDTTEMGARPSPMSRVATRSLSLPGTGSRDVIRAQQIRAGAEPAPPAGAAGGRTSLQASHSSVSAGFSHSQEAHTHSAIAPPQL